MGTTHDSTLRLCVDYLRLNKATVVDTYRIPRMDDLIDSLGDATVLSILDANCVYWQIQISPEDRDKK